MLFRSPHDEQPHIHVSEAYHPNEREKRRFTELQAVRDQAATALKLDPSLIAPKALLFSVARDDSAPARAALMSWQRELLKL